MNTSNWKALAGLATLLAVAVWSQAPAQRGDKKPAPKPPEPPAAAKEEAKKAPPTHKVESKPFKIELVVKGIVEAEALHEIAYRPTPTAGVAYAAGPLTVNKVVAHGAAVKKGDVLVAFDTRKIDQAIAQAEIDLKVLEVNLKVAETELMILSKSVPVDVEEAKRAKVEADEDLDYFVKTGRAETETRAKSEVKYWAFYLEYQKEQLHQLEKMYKANDLTEETEQIILKRARFYVESAVEQLKMAKVDYDFIVKTVLPRKETTLRQGVVKQAVALDKASTLPLQVAQKHRALVKMHFDHERLTSGLDVLKKDREAMTMLAPADGIVFFGKFTPGQWANAVSGKLVVGGAVPPDEVIMTVVKASPLLARLQIDEEDFHLVQVGLAGKVKIVANPALKLSTKVASRSAVPALPGKFEARVALDVGKAREVVPGMACEIRFVPYSVKKAVVVPASAVVEEDDKHFVFVLWPNNQNGTKREVLLGQTHDGKIEIIDGLSDGQIILLDPEGNKKSEPAKGGAGS